MGCTHALSPLPAHQCVEGLLSIQGLLPHPSLYKVSIVYEGCLVPIDMYLYTAPPGPPTGVTAVQSGPTSVSVSWTAPTSGGPVTRYDIYYVANGGPSTSGGSTNSTSYVLTNLQVGVQYNMSVIAVGTSLPSLSANVILNIRKLKAYFECTLLLQIVVWHMGQDALAFTSSCVSIFLILFLTSTWTCGWTPSLQRDLHNHHTHMATSSCPQWGDHHVSGDLLHQWHVQHSHTPSDNNRAGTKDHLHLLCLCLHHHRTRDTTTSTDKHCRYM